LQWEWKSINIAGPGDLCHDRFNLFVVIRCLEKRCDTATRHRQTRHDEVRHWRVLNFCALFTSMCSPLLQDVEGRRTGRGALEPKSRDQVSGSGWVYFHFQPQRNFFALAFQIRTIDLPNQGIRLTKQFFIPAHITSLAAKVGLILAPAVPKSAFFAN
jgi:hypothetical protein